MFQNLPQELPLYKEIELQEHVLLIHINPYWVIQLEVLVHEPLNDFKVIWERPTPKPTPTAASTVKLPITEAITIIDLLLMAFFDVPVANFNKN